MVKRRKPKTQPKRKKLRALPQRLHTVEYLLEQGTLQQMLEAKEQMNGLLKYYWEYYSELALQRSQVQEKLKKSLIQVCLTNYKFQNWQRAVKWKYGLHPLSTVGSISGIGQRFNTGTDVNSEVPSFPALYIASDKDTALQETLGQIGVPGSSLSARERALTNPQSEVIVSISGEVEKIIDLTDARKLEGFVELIHEFQISDALKTAAKKLGQPNPTVVQNEEQLLETLLINNWRMAPSQYDVPANSQIFGHLIYQAGIEGILFPSKFTGKECLAIFPNNFAMSSSYIAYDDEPPHEKVPKRIDGSNWRICDLLPKELIL